MPWFQGKYYPSYKKESLAKAKKEHAKAKKELKKYQTYIDNAAAVLAAGHGWVVDKEDFASATKARMYCYSVSKKVGISLHTGATTLGYASLNKMIFGYGKAKNKSRALGYVALAAHLERLHYLKTHGVGAVFEASTFPHLTVGQLEHMLAAIPALSPQPGMKKYKAKNNKSALFNLVDEVSVLDETMLHSFTTPTENPPISVKEPSKWAGPGQRRYVAHFLNGPAKGKKKSGMGDPPGSIEWTRDGSAGDNEVGVKVADDGLLAPVSVKTGKQVYTYHLVDYFVRGRKRVLDPHGKGEIIGDYLKVGRYFCADKGGNNGS